MSWLKIAPSFLFIPPSSSSWLHPVPYSPYELTRPAGCTDRGVRGIEGGIEGIEGREMKTKHNLAPWNLQTPPLTPLPLPPPPPPPLLMGPE